MSQSMPPIKPVAHPAEALTEADQVQVSTLAQQAADWLWTVEAVRVVVPPIPSINDRLNIFFALHHMREFRSYVQPFIRDDTRVTAFEDAVIARIFAVIGGKAASHV